MMDSAHSPGLLLIPVPAVRRRFHLLFLRLFFCGAVGTESCGVRDGGARAPLELHTDFRVRRHAGTTVKNKSADRIHDLATTHQVTFGKSFGVTRDQSRRVVCHHKFSRRGIRGNRGCFSRQHAKHPNGSCRSTRANQPRHGEGEGEVIVGAPPCHRRTRSPLILRRPLNMFDNNGIHRRRGRLHCQPKLLPERGKQRRT